MMLKWSCYLVIATAVLALTANLFANGGAGYGLPVHPYVYYGVMGLALAVPLFWFISHFALALIMGFSGGGLKEGLKLGFILGLGMALGRSWLNVAAVGGGIMLGQGPVMWAILAFVAAAFLFALDWALHYFWHHNQAVG